MKTIQILKGLPACGKSTYAKKKVKENKDWARVNKDDIRAMLGTEFSGKLENSVLKIRDFIIKEMVDSGFNIIVDDTNLNPVHEQTIRQTHSQSSKIELYEDFTQDVDECIKRDAKRSPSVGKEVILSMYRKYMKPIPKKVEFDPNLPNAIIVDVDGTIALTGDRSVYDYSKVMLDIPNTEVINVIYNIVRVKNYAVIIVSGREDSCQEQTVVWIENNTPLYPSRILMRKTGDKRKDYIVKKEIYENNIKGKYNVLAVFDDRDQVVRMWREQGLQVFQVAEGNF